MATDGLDAALFVDNDQRYIDQVRLCGPKVTTMKVAGSDPLQGVLLTSPAYQAHVNGLTKAGKATAEIVQKLIAMESRGKQVEFLDPGSGIQAADADRIRSWVESRKGQNLAVLVDYDRTLTVIEGGIFFAPSLEALRIRLHELLPEVDSSTLTVEGFVNYSMGGSVRVTMLQDLFDFLYANNVAVYVLTNNGACATAADLFHAVVSVLTKGRPVKYLCGVNFGLDKQKAFQSDESLRPLCSRKGGRRRKRTKKSKQSKQTKKARPKN